MKGNGSSQKLTTWTKKLRHLLCELCASLIISEFLLVNIRKEKRG